jgi:hypothetical protein
LKYLALKEKQQQEAAQAAAAAAAPVEDVEVERRDDAAATLLGMGADPRPAPEDQAIQPTFASLFLLEAEQQAKVCCVASHSCTCPALLRCMILWSAACPAGLQCMGCQGLLLPPAA